MRYSDWTTCGSEWAVISRSSKPLRVGYAISGVFDSHTLPQSLILCEEFHCDDSLTNCSMSSLKNRWRAINWLCHGRRGLTDGEMPEAGQREPL